MTYKETLNTYTSSYFEDSPQARRTVDPRLNKKGTTLHTITYTNLPSLCRVMAWSVRAPQILKYGRCSGHEDFTGLYMPKTNAPFKWLSCSPWTKSSLNGRAGLMRCATLLRNATAHILSPHYAHDIRLVTPQSPRTPRQLVFVNANLRSTDEPCMPSSAVATHLQSPQDAHGVRLVIPHAPHKRRRHVFVNCQINYG